MSSNVYLKAEHIQKRYGKKLVVKDVSLEVGEGEIVGLLGPNGAGKTTTFYMIVGIIKPNAGVVALDNMSLNKMPMYKRARLGITYLPQESSVFRKLSVEDNIRTVLELRNLSRREIDNKTEELLEELSIQHIRKSKAYYLSGGERRRTEIARALALDPKILLLDEPFAGIDPIAVMDIQKTIMHLKKKNIGVLITDHNVRETLSITDRAYIIFEGTILLSGSADELINDKKAREIYLGENFKI